ncbi:uncharacterized protein LOC114291256 [Camellia sinensis]|uniref:uncharacterized protein LOC114291256 n=1 Tax=Camellia sinensis TaxID=4442 RepID=UPI001035C998|nr:uncharacterized protein LOC114291256 [Camellia sinensis]
MSVDLVALNTHGNLDEQIAQLMQCKPLSEPELWCFQYHLMPLAEYQQLSHNLNECMICTVPTLKKVVDLLLELDKLLFSVGGYSYLYEPLWRVGMITSEFCVILVCLMIY